MTMAGILAQRASVARTGMHVFTNTRLIIVRPMRVQMKAARACDSRDFLVMGNPFETYNDEVDRFLSKPRTITSATEQQL